MMKPEPERNSRWSARRNEDGETDRLRLTDLECWDELGEGDEEKVQVEEELELLVEHERQERGDVVLLVRDLVGDKRALELGWNERTRTKGG